MARGTWQGSGTWQTAGGGRGPVVAVVAAVIFAAVVAAKPVAHAVSAVGRVVAEVLTAALYVAASLAGVAVLAGVGLAVRGVVRWQARRAVSRAAPAVPSWPDRPALGATPRALEAGRPVVGVVVSERDYLETRKLEA